MHSRTSVPLSCPAATPRSGSRCFTGRCLVEHTVCVRTSDTHAYRDRPISEHELEMLRLALSSFRDGSGQVVLKKTGESMPGFRDYERSLAAVLGGSTTENKGIFDVEVPTADKPFGISCKMASMPPPKALCSFMELSNSAALFRNHLLTLQINWLSEPMLAGPAIIDLVSAWHSAVSGMIDVPNSRYSVLAHDSTWRTFQILCFSLDLKIADPKGDIDWLAEGKALNGYIDDEGRRHRLWQCYFNSGGQLKYFPLLRWADWVTPRFTLEQPPVASPLEKAQRYFSVLWPR